MSVSSISTQFISAVERRFATRADRFRLALSAGFVVAAVGFLMVGPGGRIGVADSIWGAMGLPTSGGSTSQAYSQPEAASPQYASRRHARAARSDVHAARFEASAKPVALGRHSMCVRLCDGFAFPVGDYHGDGDRPAHEATCQSQCPGARTALFVLPSGAETIGEAVQVGTGRSYSQIPDAFHYTTYIDQSCSCHPHGGNRIKSLLHDFTLRRGDAVMTSKGLQVFHGGASFPFKRKDFVALSKSRDVREAARGNLKAIERASLARPTIVDVAQTKPKPAPLAGLKPLEHQAQLTTSVAPAR